MNITVITPPPFEPVTLTEVYKQLRLAPDNEGSPGEESHPDDSLLSGYITTARVAIESMVRRSLVQQTLRLSVAGFPSAIPSWPAFLRRSTQPTVLRLHRPPLIRVDSVRYYDGDNVLQTVDPANYYTTDEEVPELRFVSSFSAPTVYDRPDAVRVDYVTGYAPSGSPAALQEDYIGNVPRALKDAILIGVQLLYDNMTPQDAAAARTMQQAMAHPFKVYLSP